MLLKFFSWQICHYDNQKKMRKKIVLYCSYFDKYWTSKPNEAFKIQQCLGVLTRIEWSGCLILIFTNCLKVGNKTAGLIISCCLLFLLLIWSFWPSCCYSGIWFVHFWYLVSQFERGTFMHRNQNHKSPLGYEHLSQTPFFQIFFHRLSKMLETVPLSSEVSDRVPVVGTLWFFRKAVRSGASWLPLVLRRVSGPVGSPRTQPATHTNMSHFTLT